MAIGHLLLFFLACGAVTFPLTLFAVRAAASLSGNSRLARRIDGAFEKMLTISIIVWLLGIFAFYGIALYLERQKYCDDQRSNQLTYECRKLFGQAE